ncbi:ERF family protein [Bacillus cereus group sp. BfR-BA-01494]|uniref:ERF family protein n=1 Tax=Bacillus cereus group sp. BfR-BA-01494 TaxID=2920362 RepID=UPI001F55ADE2
MRSSETLGKLADALSVAQGEWDNPKNTNVNPQFKSRYAPLDVVINTVKPFLSKQGLSFIQSTSSVEENVIVTTRLMHKSGEWIESDPLTLPAYQLKKGGVKDFNAQGAGSAITYGRRYSLTALLGISSEDDDDGNNASGYNPNNQGNNNSGNQGGYTPDPEKLGKIAYAKRKALEKKNNVTEDDVNNELRKVIPNWTPSTKDATILQKAVDVMKGWGV